jgi:hypothetical protein
VKRIACLAIFFAALIEFAVERARFDLWIMSVAAVTLLWSAVARTQHARVVSQKHNHNISSSKK